MTTRSDILRELNFSEAAPSWAVEGELSPLGWDAPVEQVMTTSVPIAQPATPMADVMQMMMNAAQKRVIVVDEKQQVVGIITDGDLLAHIPVESRSALLNNLSDVWMQRASLESSGQVPVNDSQQIAKDMMTSPVIVVPMGTSVRQALRLIMEHHIKRLPVIDGAGHVVGLVGRSGLMRALL